MVTLEESNGLKSEEMPFQVYLYLFLFYQCHLFLHTGLIGGLRRYNEFGIRLAFWVNQKEMFLS